MLFAALLTLASLAVADLRVFGERGSKDCQDCLAEVEGKCRGPTSSDQFNDCFCGIGEEGLAWPRLTECLTGSNAKCTKDDEYDILLMDWGSHCFAYKKDEEEEVCVDSTQDDKLLLSVADSFCTEFLTLTTGSGSASATASESSSAETTTTDDDDDDDDVTTTITSAPETETSAPSTTDATTTAETTTRSTVIPGSDSDVGAGSGGNSNGDDGDSNSEESSAGGSGDEDDGVGSLSATSLSTLAILALCASGLVLQLF